MNLKTSPKPFLPHQELLRLIQANGLFSHRLKGFESRLQQQEMMANVIDAYNKEHIALIEAGTGTGKSLAYLVPALIWAARFSERTVISTNTITLQEQLVHKDIPSLLEILNLQLKIVLVKGMNNYICLRKFEDVQSELPLFSSQGDQEMAKIEQWLQTSTDGSRSEMPFTPLPATWERIGAEHASCSHNECPHYENCYFYKARRFAQDAHLLIVNHHLLFADLIKRGDTQNSNGSSILPPYKRIILDEAHHIEDVATEHFAFRLNRLDLIKGIGKLSAENVSSSPGKLLVLKEKLQKIARTYPSQEVLQIINRLAIDLPSFSHSLQDNIHQVFDLFAQFIDDINRPLHFSSSEVKGGVKLRILDRHQNHPKWQSELVPNVKSLIESLKHYQEVLNNIEGDLKLIDNDRLQEQTKSVRFDIQALSALLGEAVNRLNRFFSPTQNSSRVCWMETQNLKKWINVQLMDVEWDVSRKLVDALFNKFSTIILCSATLTTNKKFDFIRRSLGLSSHLSDRMITENTYSSPFDFRKQALLAVPTDMPLPGDPDFNDRAFENIWNAIEASKGQVFVLFTSYNMLQKCHQVLAMRLNEHRYPVFKQGDDNRRALLNKFKTTRHAVLFGTDSFWEGVDVAGDALRCVIIAKLPFKVPGEPIIEARAEAISKQGGDPFNDFAVPHAIVKFKQGFGRLIRNKWDRGCIICLDIRLVTKNYGKLFLNSLPVCQELFMNSSLLWPKVKEFYRKTYHLVKQNPFS